VFGNFVRLSPDGASVYFGINRPSAVEEPHFIYRIPLDASSPPVAVDALEMNFDLVFDDRAGGSSPRSRRSRRTGSTSSMTTRPSRTVRW